jgi:hypothetical protein
MVSGRLIARRIHGSARLGTPTIAAANRETSAKNNIAMNQIEVRSIAALATLAIMALLWWFGVLHR